MKPLLRIAVVSFASLSPSIALAQMASPHLPNWIASPISAIRPSQALPSETADPDWTRVIRLRPGERFVVAADGWGMPRERTFVDADDASITLLNLTAPGLSGDARGALREAVLFHQTDVVNVLSGRGFRFDALELRPS